MDDALRHALASRLLELADDELILGHRNSEWCGHAPILEEDIAFANIALDEIGHASIWYTMLAQLLGKDEASYPDELVFQRAPAEFRCVQMVTLPIGDWAFSMTRQYLFDAYEAELLGLLTHSRHKPLQDAAAKLRKEEAYHLRHTSAWVTRLGLGTEESHRRMQAALNALWGYALQLFAPTPGQDSLIQAEYFPAAEQLRSSWLGRVTSHLADAGLTIPADAVPPAESRSIHSDHLAELLAEMQKVARLDPVAEW